MCDKQRLYQIIDLYIDDEIDEKTFCDEFYYVYNLELDYRKLLEEGRALFAELNEVVSRFSEYEEDQKLDEKAFADKEELRIKIINVHKKLKSSIQQSFNGHHPNL